MPEVKITKFGGSFVFSGEEHPFMFDSEKGRFAINNMTEHKAHIFLRLLSAVGGSSGAPPATAEPAPPKPAPAAAPPVTPNRPAVAVRPGGGPPKPPPVDEAKEAEARKEDAASAPPTPEEMLDPEPPVTVTQGRDMKAEADKAVQEMAAEPKPKVKRKRRTKAQIEADKKAEEAKAAEAKEDTPDGGLAPEGGEEMKSGPRGEEPPWDEKEKEESERPAPLSPSELEALPRNDDGHINNCALAHGEKEGECQVCKGNCPDRKVFASTGHGERTTETEKRQEEKAEKEKAKKAADAPEIDMTVVKSKTKLRGILNYLIDLGYPSVETVTDRCMEIKSEVPILDRVADLAERIPRTLAVMGWPEED
jgi:hypothetical protein